MSDEDAFLRAIQDDPNDQATLRAYADWLAERGEPRAEFVRLRADYLRQPSTSALHRLWSAGRTLEASWRDLIWGNAAAPDLRTLLALGRLQGLLIGYASCSHHASDISYEFVAHLRPLRGDIQALANARYTGYLPVHLEPLSDIESELRAILSRWLFMEQRTTGAHGQLALATEHGREWMLGEAMTHLQEVLRPEAGWRARVAGDAYYAVDGEDVVLRAGDRVLFLHFSVSD